MALTPGTRLGPYEITAPLGAGGMGEVYRARDTRLDRTVAIKVVSDAVAGSPELRDRFQREARAVAALNHSHICSLFDVGHHEGTDFLVMEYLQGETLAARLETARGAPLPQREALEIATQVADALAAAHRAGIVHRDLKPGNIMLVRRPGVSGAGEAKLFDFGLAKVTPAAVAASGLSVAPTGLTPVTMQGTILGTLQYMAPEQIEGKEADARTDLFAFGCVLYEMLTGRRPFAGSTQASLIASILKEEPAPIAAVVPDAPPALEFLVRRCLAKDPDERWTSARDVLLQLRWIAEQQRVVGDRQAPDSRPRRARALTMSAAAFIIGGALAGSGVWLGIPSSEAPLLRFTIPPPPGTTFQSTGFNAVATRPIVSPDGASIAFVSLGIGGQTLWVRRLDAVEARELAGTVGAIHPFWSPDGRSLEFFADGKLTRIDVSGGAAQVICDAPLGSGGAWNADDVIVFAPSPNTGLFRVSAAGGPPSPVTMLDAAAQESSHRWPLFLPDGRRFLYLARTTSRQNDAVHLGALDGSPSRRLVASQSNAAFTAPDTLLFTRGGTLMAQRIDLDRAEVIGEPSSVAQDIVEDAFMNLAAFSASNAGVLAYRTGSGTLSQLIWFDRSGRRLDAVGDSGADLTVPQLSADGRKVAVVSQGDVWIRDLVRDTFSRLTFRGGTENNCCPVWSPDGAVVAYRRDTGGGGDIYRRDAAGAGDEEVLLSIDDSNTPTDWTPDGRFVLFQTTSRVDVWMLPVDGDRKPVPLLRSDANEHQARVSPDGRWIAYV